MKAFVTGGTGFIGRRLIERLKKDNIGVVALVRNSNHGLPEDVEIVYGDILDPASFENVGNGCSRLYHLAAMISFDPDKKEELLNVNGVGTANVLAAASGWNIERSVVVSSACTMGISYDKGHYLNEDSIPTEAVINENPYLESKLVAEATAIKSSNKQCVVIVNPTTVYGPGDKTLNSGTLIKSIACSFAVPVPPGGSNVIDVDDVVGGIIAAGEKGKSGCRYIICSENLEFAEIFNIVAEVVKHNPIMVRVPGCMRLPMAAVAKIVGSLNKSRLITPQIISDMFAYKYFSSEKSKNELEWSPKYSFSECVERAWDFYKHNGII